MSSNVAALTRAPRERGTFGYTIVEAPVLKSSPRLRAARTAAWSIVVGRGRGSNPRPKDSRLMVLVDCPNEPVNACATRNLVPRRDRLDLTESGRFPIITDE